MRSREISAESPPVTHHEHTRRVGQYLDEDGGRHWLRIVEIGGDTSGGESPGAADRPRRYRVDLALPGMSGGWGVSLDGFASLVEAEEYVTMTSTVEWSAEPTITALLAGRARHDASVAVWYSGGRRAAAELVSAEPTFALEDFVDVDPEAVEIVVDAASVAKVGHAA